MSSQEVRSKNSFIFIFRTDRAVSYINVTFTCKYHRLRHNKSELDKRLWRSEDNQMVWGRSAEENWTLSLLITFFSQLSFYANSCEFLQWVQYSRSVVIRDLSWHRMSLTPARELDYNPSERRGDTGRWNIFPPALGAANWIKFVIFSNLDSAPGWLLCAENFPILFFVELN